MGEGVRVAIVDHESNEKPSLDCSKIKQRLRREHFKHEKLAYTQFENDDGQKKNHKMGRWVLVFGGGSFKGTIICGCIRYDIKKVATQHLSYYDGDID